MAKKPEVSGITREMDKVVESAQAALIAEKALIREKKEEVARNKTIIAKVPVPLRRSPNLSSEYIVGTMPAGVSFEIDSEFKSQIYGEFYKLGNGMYITKGGLYEIN